MDQILLIESSGLSFSVGNIPPAISEAAFKTGLMMLKGVPATVLDVRNGNGRTYSEKEIRKSLSKLKKENAFSNRRMHCSADDHPKDSYVQPIKASHIITDAYVKKGEDGKSYLMNDWLILNTNNGKNLKALVQAKASIGTSIRGLGQLNEDTKHVENYDYLGTDAVGNPSAQTFASPGQMEVAVESLDPDEVREITEQLENGNMFDLIESIKIFKAKHFKDDKPVNPGSRDVTRDLLQIQREAVQAGLRESALFPLDALTDQIYGTTLADRIGIPPNTSQNYTSDKDKDALNKALRELEATKNLATHYQDIAETLETQKEEHEKKIAAFEDVSTTIYEQLQSATEQLNDGSTTKEARAITERALRTVRQIQREARTLIKGLETTLENAIRVGDQYAENAIVLRRIVDTLYNQFLETSDKNNYVSSKGLAIKVDERIKGQGNARQALTEGLDRKHGPSVSHSGNRSGWV
jgi:hypothetical protein